MLLQLRSWPHLSGNRGAPAQHARPRQDLSAPRARQPGETRKDRRCRGRGPDAQGPGPASSLPAPKPSPEVCASCLFSCIPSRPLSSLEPLPQHQTLPPPVAACRGSSRLHPPNQLLSSPPASFTAPPPRLLWPHGSSGAPPTTRASGCLPLRRLLPDWYSYLISQLSAWRSARCLPDLWAGWGHTLGTACPPQSPAREALLLAWGSNPQSGGNRAPWEDHTGRFTRPHRESLHAWLSSWQE